MLRAYFQYKYMGKLMIITALYKEKPASKSNVSPRTRDDNRL